MPRRSSLTIDPEECRCIGVLLEQCPVPVARCHQCWFSNEEGQPTLVRIEVFNTIRERRDGFMPT
jgi:hypothetical protein